MSVVCAGRRARDATLPVVVVAAPRVAVVRELRPFGLLECWCNGVSLGLGVIVRGRPSSDAGGKQPVGGDRFRGVLLVGAPDIVVSLQRLATTDTQHDKSVVRWPAHRALGRAFAALLGVEAAKHVFGTRSNFADTIAENAMLYSYCGLAAPDDGGGGVRQPAAALALCRALLEPLRLADAPLDEAAADAGGDVAVALPPPVSTARVEVSRETTVQALAAAVSRRAAVPGAFRALPFERKSLPHWQAAIVNAGLPMPKSRSGNVDLCCELGARQSLPIGGDAAETFDRLVGSHCTPAVRQQAALVSRAVAALYARLAVPAFGGASACARKRQSRDASPPPLAQHRSKRRAPAAPRIETRGRSQRDETAELEAVGVPSNDDDDGGGDRDGGGDGGDDGGDSVAAVAASSERSTAGARLDDEDADSGGDGDDAAAELVRLRAAPAAFVRAPMAPQCVVVTMSSLKATGLASVAEIASAVTTAAAAAARRSSDRAGASDAAVDKRAAAAAAAAADGGGADVFDVAAERRRRQASVQGRWRRLRGVRDGELLRELQAALAVADAGESQALLARVKELIDARMRATTLACASSLDDAATRFFGTARRYSIVYADPPWRYGDPTHLSGTSKHYATMSVGELARMPVGALAEPDAVLLLWSTFHMLEQSQTLMHAWGFKPLTVFVVWIKIDRVGNPLHKLGHYTRANAEFLLLGTRGTLRVTERERRDKFVGSIVREAPRQHSRKPDVVAEKIVRVFRDLPRIELFARRSRADWDAWGNEAERFDAGGGVGDDGGDDGDDGDDDGDDAAAADAEAGGGVVQAARRAHAAREQYDDVDAMTLRRDASFATPLFGDQWVRDGDGGGDGGEAAPTAVRDIRWYLERSGAHAPPLHTLYARCNVAQVQAQRELIRAYQDHNADVLFALNHNATQARVRLRARPTPPTK